LLVLKVVGGLELGDEGLLVLEEGLGLVEEVGGLFLEFFCWYWGLVFEFF